jgi:hypothetical protein
VKGCNKYQKGTAKNLRSSLPLVGNSEFENFINHGVELTLAQSSDSGKLQIHTMPVGIHDGYFSLQVAKTGTFPAGG